MDIETGMARARAADIKQIGSQALALDPHSPFHLTSFQRHLFRLFSSACNYFNLRFPCCSFSPFHTSLLVCILARRHPPPTPTKMPYRIRIINPNSNSSMTDSLRAPIDSLNYNDVRSCFLFSSLHTLQTIPTPPHHPASHPLSHPPPFPETKTKNKTPTNKKTPNRPNTPTSPAPPHPPTPSTTSPTPNPPPPPASPSSSPLPPHQSPTTQIS